jgi:photosystem II stability/assembly factor-like uncharacterized protein
VAPARRDRHRAARLGPAGCALPRDAGGVIKLSPDGGATWKDAGSAGLPVNELAVDNDGVLYASVAGGEVKRSTDGGASWSRLVKLE